MAKSIQRRTVLFLFKFLLFDLLWCLQTTFTSFSTVELYVNACLASLILTLPYVLTKKDRFLLPLALAVDVLLMANLMYNRTYNSAIPLNNYFISGNLRDFLPSVVDSIRWYDALLPLSTLVFPFVVPNKEVQGKHERRNYFVQTSIVALVSVALVVWKGGIVKAMNSLHSRNFYTCGAPMYTVFGCILNDLVKQKADLTEVDKREINDWLDGRHRCDSLPANMETRKNLVLVLCESLESWVLERKVEGVEITPTLNRLLKDSTTLYAPRVLTQVKGGRSIDCQLMINAGLLPIDNGSYSFEYPNNVYPTLTKAMTEKHGAESMLFTVDKPIIWNQGIIAHSFGIKRVFSRNDWNNKEGMGPRKNLGDEPFFQQAVAKIEDENLWPVGTPVFMQFVTYSGHAPFRIPEKMHRIHLHDDYPEKLHDYMVTANYTDHALSILLDYLRKRPDFSETMIVIVGDHEGLAADREELCESEKGRGLVSDKQFTPFIVVNSPVGMRYQPVMGQIDIYPTLLRLMGLEQYWWTGLGQSILDAHKAPVAVAPDLHMEGEPQHVSQQEIEHLQHAYDISDKMIRYNYWQNQD